MCVQNGGSSRGVRSPSLWAPSSAHSCTTTPLSKGQQSRTALAVCQLIAGPKDLRGSKAARGGGADGSGGDGGFGSDDDNFFGKHGPLFLGVLLADEASSVCAGIRFVKKVSYF